MIFIANLQKYSEMQSIGHLCEHYERSVKSGNYGNPDIDKTKLHLDVKNYAPDRQMEQTAYIKQKIEEIMGERKLRKDAVRMCCWIVDKPNSLPADKEDAFFQAVYDFMVNRYGSKSGIGEDIVISAFVHRSERTPHMHFAFMPILERDGVKGFVAKEVVCRSDLETFHQDLGAYLEEKKICKKSDILNGKTKRKPNGKAYSVNELKRQRHLERNREWNTTETVERKWTR